MVVYIVLKSNKKREEVGGNRLNQLTSHDKIDKARVTKTRLGTGFHIYKEIGYTTQRSRFNWLFERVE
jgi:hypothetical protein